ncbi:MAG: DsbA family protein [Proteobacteria bacterium]|nr:DsbA family protein [Pseudomonadota bacterium]
MSFSKKSQKPSNFKLVIASIIVATIAGALYFNNSNKTDSNNATETKDAKANSDIKSSGLDPDKDVSDVKDVEQVVAKWIEANPQAIINSVQNMQKKMMEEQMKNAQKNIGQKQNELYNDSNSPQFAPEGYDVSMVEFYDYACGYCKKAQTIVDELLKSDSKVRVIYKDFPILGEPSQEMSKVSIAVNIVAPNSFRKFHDALMKTNERGKSAALKAVKTAGIDVKKVEDALKNEKDKIEKIIQDNLALGSSIGITGTPGFVIGEELIPGAMDVGVFKEKINSIRSK